MKNRLNATAAKLTSRKFATHAACFSLGTLSVLAVHRYNTAHLRTLGLSREAFDLLTTDQTNFVRFTSKHTEHAFRVTLEQWI